MNVKHMQPSALVIHALDWEWLQLRPCVKPDNGLFFKLNYVCSLFLPPSLAQSPWLHVSTSTYYLCNGSRWSALFFSGSCQWEEDAHCFYLDVRAFVWYVARMKPSVCAFFTIVTKIAKFKKRKCFTWNTMWICPLCVLQLSWPYSLTWRTWLTLCQLAHCWRTLWWQPVCSSSGTLYLSNYIRSKVSWIIVSQNTVFYLLWSQKKRIG